MNKTGSLGLVAFCALAAAAVVAAPAGAPAGSTGVCKDGSYYSGPVKKGACRGHQGVKDWWGGDSAGSAAAPAATTRAAPAVAVQSPPPVVAPAAPRPQAAAPVAPRPSVAAPAVQAAGGGAGQVWANSGTKVYHCQGDKWYGKTKSGSYMSEADARAKGFHPDHGKGCQ